MIVNKDNQVAEYMDRTLFQYPLVAGQKFEILEIIKRLLLPQVAKDKKSLDLNLDALLNSITPDLFNRFLGAVLLAKGETQASLASVGSFEARGRAFAFMLKDGAEGEVIKDFFPLNRPWLQATLLEMGLDLNALTSTASESFKKASRRVQKS